MGRRVSAIRRRRRFAVRRISLLVARLRLVVGSGVAIGCQFVVRGVRLGPAVTVSPLLVRAALPAVEACVIGRGELEFGDAYGDLPDGLGLDLG